jgi:hypothetical protein
MAGYDAYRASEGGSFVKIADRVPGPSYEDLLVNVGKTYIYVVTVGGSSRPRKQVFNRHEGRGSLRLFSGLVGSACT